MTKFRAGFDYSCAEASFAVLDEDDKILFDRHLLLGSRDASALPAWIADCLLEHKLKPESIDEWSVGAGPGSFTGLRVASAFVMGLTFRKTGVRTRTVSTASAIAASAGGLKEQAQNVLTLYDGRKNEILAFGLKKNGVWFADDRYSGIFADGAALERMAEQYDAFAALTRDFEAVRKVCGETFASKVITVEHLSAAELVKADPDCFDSKLTNLVYLRPPVFVEPKPIRVFV